MAILDDVSIYTGHLQVVLRELNLKNLSINDYTGQLHVSAYTGHLQVVIRELKLKNLST